MRSLAHIPLGRHFYPKRTRRLGVNSKSQSLPRDAVRRLDALSARDGVQTANLSAGAHILVDNARSGIHMASLLQGFVRIGGDVRDASVCPGGVGVVVTQLRTPETANSTPWYHKMARATTERTNNRIGRSAVIATTTQGTNNKAISTIVAPSKVAGENRQQGVRFKSERSRSELAQPASDNESGPTAHDSAYSRGVGVYYFHVKFKRTMLRRAWPDRK